MKDSRMGCHARLAALMVCAGAIPGCKSGGPVIPDGRYVSADWKESVTVGDGRMKFQLSGHPVREYHFRLEADSSLSFTMPATDAFKGAASFDWKWEPPVIVRMDRKGKQVIEKYHFTP